MVGQSERAHRVPQPGKPLSGLATDDVGQAKGGEGGECVDQISGGGGGVTGGVKRCGHNATTASEARSGRKPKNLAFAPVLFISPRGVGCEFSRACIVIVLRQKAEGGWSLPSQPLQLQNPPL